MERARLAYYPGRSGQIYIVAKRRWFFGSPNDAATHGSPWPYDAHVPLIFFGYGIGAQQIERRVRPAAIAPTLARFLGIDHPAAELALPELR